MMLEKFMMRRMPRIGGRGFVSPTKYLDFKPSQHRHEPRSFVPADMPEALEYIIILKYSTKSFGCERSCRRVAP